MFKSKPLVAITGLLVAALLFVGFNSFITHGKNKATVEPALYWYEFDDANDVVGTLLNPSGMVTKTVAKSSLTSCPDGSGNICIRGYDNDQEEGNTDHSGPATDYRVLYP